MYIIDRMMAIGLTAWSNQKFEESLVITLLGIAAASKLHYPRKSDRGAFNAYLKDKLTEIISRYLGDVPMPGVVTSCPVGSASLEDILYKNLRCSLVHELVFPDNIELKDALDMRSPIEVHPDGKVVFCNRLPLALMYTVIDDPKVFEIQVSESD